MESLVYQFKDPLATTLIFWLGASREGPQSLIDLNHIHIRDGDDWICGRSIALHNEQLLRCEGRDPDEEEACRQCAERIVAHFGDAMLIH